MKLFYIIAICMLLGSSCEEEDPIGIWNEPTIEFTSNRNTFIIVYGNSNGMTDSVQAGTSSPSALCPIDLNDTFMYYEIISNDSSYGTVELRYSLTKKEAYQRNDFLLVFDSTRITAERRLTLFQSDRMTDTVSSLSNYHLGRSKIFISF